MLNWEESKSLRGVDMLLTSNPGIGDASLAEELQRENPATVIIDKIHHVIEHYAFDIPPPPPARAERAQIDSGVIASRTPIKVQHALTVTHQLTCLSLTQHNLPLAQKKKKKKAPHLLAAPVLLSNDPFIKP